MIYVEVKMIELIQLEINNGAINLLYKKGAISTDQVDVDLNECWNNQYFIFRDQGQSAIVRLNLEESQFTLVKSKELQFQGVKPLDARQTCVFDSLKHMQLSVILGGAGTGKTTLTLAFALQQLFRNDKKIVLCKSTAFVGGKSNAIAAIPGDHREKLAGYIDSYLYTFRRILGDHAEHYLYEWEEKGMIEFKPLELLRGMHFEDSIVILDEAQNTTPHELLTLMSRVSDTSKLIIMGDLLQVDTGLRFDETGLGALTESEAFLDNDVSAIIELKAQYRGALADLAIEIIQEIREYKNEEIIDKQPNICFNKAIKEN